MVTQTLIWPMVPSVVFLVFSIIISATSNAKNWHNSKTVIGVSQNGKDDENCWVNISRPCFTLSFAMKKPNLNNTKIVISKGDHYLDERIAISGFEDLELVSNSTDAANIICSKNAGLSFTKGRGLSLELLSIVNCGMNHTSTSKLNGSNLVLFSSLFVEAFINIKLEHVKIDSSVGMGAVFYDVAGNVSFVNVTFSNNKQKFFYAKKGFSSGGGIYIEFTQRSKNSSTVYNSNALYSFHGCNFESNVAEHNYSHPSPIDDSNNYITFGRGGAVSLMSSGGAKGNFFSFYKCNFKNNSALWGGALFAEFHGQSGSNTIFVDSCHFVENFASYGGGAVRIGLASDNQMGYNLIRIRNCDFMKNIAKVGGAFSQYREEKDSIKKEVTLFDNCKFIGNMAFLGAAIHMSVTQFELNGILFSGNQINGLMEWTSGKGALYLMASYGSFKNNNTIENNTWTAIVLEFSTLEMFGYVLFSKNTGVNGGAIAFYGESWIILQEKSLVEFKENKAIRLGGALYIETPGPPMAPMNSTEFMVYRCAILYGNRTEHPISFNTTVRFINNTAPVASGSSVFISTLNWCRHTDEQKFNNTALQWGNFFYEGNKPFIVTNPVIMEIFKEEWMAAPSIPFQPHIILRDELWSVTYGTVKVVIESKGNKVKLAGSDVFAVRRKLPMISVTGPVGTRFNVTVETAVGLILRAFVQDAMLDNCPLGYFQDQGDITCTCLSSKGMEKGVTHCQGPDVYILRGRWGNPRGRDIDFARHHCPRNYCRKCMKSGTDEIECIFEKERQCGTNRKWDSVLCSSCKEGYSVKLGNEECAQCSDTSLLWLLLWIFVLTIFVFIILILNVRNYFTYLNAYLYSYQVIPLLLAGNHYIDIFISFVMGLTNFSGTGGNVGVCLWDGLTDMQKMALNYITPFYIIFCTVFFVFLSSHWKRCPFNKQSTLRALALLSIFAYADFTRITFELLHHVSVDGRDVLYLQGDVEFFKGEHVPYGIAAIIVLVGIVLLFPFCLIFNHVLIQYSAKMQGIIDAFQDPFREGYKRFAVFYLICRCVLFAIFVFSDSGLVSDTVLAIACEFILIIFLFIKPYKDEKMNYFDMLMLSNIVFIATINVSLDAVTENQNRRGLQLTAVVFTYLPFLCILLQFSHWAFIEIRDYMAGRKHTHFRRKVRTGRLTSMPQRVTEDDDNDGRRFDRFQSEGGHFQHKSSDFEDHPSNDEFDYQAYRDSHN